jgi:hypothetical protein
MLPYPPSDFITPVILVEEYNLCSFSSSYFYLISLWSNVLNFQFLRTINLYILNVREQVSHPYHTTDKTVVPYILIYTFLHRRWENKNSEINGMKHYPNLICSLISL